MARLLRRRRDRAPDDRTTRSSPADTTTSSGRSCATWRSPSTGRGRSRAPPCAASPTGSRGTGPRASRPRPPPPRGHRGDAAARRTSSTCTRTTPAARCSRYGGAVPHAAHPAARGGGRGLPPGVLRRLDVLGQPRLPPHRPLRPRQRDAGAGPQGLVVGRLPAAHRPHPARHRLPLDAGRRAARLEGAGRDRLRRGGQDRDDPGDRRRPRHDRPAAPGPPAAVLPVGRLLRDPPGVLPPRRRRGALGRGARRTFPTPRRSGATWPRSTPAPALSTPASARCWTSSRPWA